MHTLSKPIAQGRTADVYLWDDRHILKLYYDWCPPHWLKDEARVARAVYDAGIPSPAVGETIEVNGRGGLIYERIDGISMLRDLNLHPWMIGKHARSLAELQIKINALSIAGLANYHDNLNYDISGVPQLSADLREKVLSILNKLTIGTHLCHGDYHPGNVLLTKNGPLVIDWMTARSGNPWADVARTSMILTVGPKGAGRQVSPVLQLMISLFHRIYLSRYLTLAPDTKHELKPWSIVIMAARLNENILPERDALIEMISKGCNHGSVVTGN